MWRALLLAIGISLCLVGGECLVLDKIILANPGSTSDFGAYGPLELATTPRRVVVPPEWAPWALLSGGAVLVLYSYSASGSSGE